MATFVIVTRVVWVHPDDGSYVASELRDRRELDRLKFSGGLFCFVTACGRLAPLSSAGGPAYASSNVVAYFKDGRRHRASGPAVLRANGDVEFWRDGRLLYAVRTGRPLRGTAWEWRLSARTPGEPSAA